jgi:hypothetical protein
MAVCSLLAALNKVCTVSFFRLVPRALLASWGCPLQETPGSNVLQRSTLLFLYCTSITRVVTNRLAEISRLGPIPRPLNLLTQRKHYSSLQRFSK